MRLNAYVAIAVYAACIATHGAIGQTPAPPLSDTVPVTPPAAGKLGADPQPPDLQLPQTDDGIIRPPPGIDRDIVKPAPPTGSNMPVITPPPKKDPQTK
jgi:hypothetical protein